MAWCFDSVQLYRPEIDFYHLDARGLLMQAQGCDALCSNREEWCLKNLNSSLFIIVVLFWMSLFLPFRVVNVTVHFNKKDGV